MIGSIVNHPLFGRGQVMEMRNAGREAVARFDNGIRAVVPFNILTMLKPAETAAAVSSVRPPAPIIAPRAEVALTPEQERRIGARRTVEALRYGVVPQKRIRELSAGLERERASLHLAFDEVANYGGAVRVVLGEYGAGKSHFFELAAQEALEQNFLTAVTSLDVREVPPNRPQRIYNSLIRNLRYPDVTDTGTLAPLFDRLLNQPAVYAPLMERLRETVFSSAIYNYSLMREHPGEALELLLDWISGEKVFIKAVRDAVSVKSKEFPIRALSMMTTSADQYCYLLSGWGWIARQAGYAGLAVLLDESEHYSLLNVRGQERADNFFKGLMYTALSSQPDCKISEEQLAHQVRSSHPFRFANRSDLLVMFAVTPSASTFDYRRWLDEDEIIELSAQLPVKAVDELMFRLFQLHREAYSNNRADHHQEVAQGLLECMEGKLINLRQMIRLAMEIYDISYAHPDFTVMQAVAELRRVMLGR
jgi:hypothetical protein